MLVLYGFVMLAGVLFLLVFPRLSDDRVKGILAKAGYDRVVSDIKKLAPGTDPVKESIGFCRRRLMTAAGILCVGSFLAFVYEVRSYMSHELIDGRLIMRNEYMGNEKNLRLKVKDAETGEDGIIDISVSERKYSNEQLAGMAAEADAILMTEILGSNDSLDLITSDMKFPPSLDGFPFKISWRTDDPLLLSSKGVIDQERFRKLGETKNIYEGILTGIHAEFKYDDFIYETDFAAKLYPEDMNRELNLPEFVKELVDEREEASGEEEYLELPVRADNTRLEYEETPDRRSLVILILVVIAALAMYYREAQELKDKVKERNAELMSEYPRMVNRFVLFYSAGLTTRGIWSRLCRDYRNSIENGGKKSYLYEEMLICEGRMNEGMGEIAAYEGFAASCGLHKYRHFVSLIGQAIGKGRADLLIQLEKEAMDAFAERKNRAKEAGEEAGTRLLFPMLMMLSVVLIIVMVPAFIAFRM